MTTRGQSRGRTRGFSLVEMVVVASAVSIVMGLCGLTLHAMFRLDRAGRAEIQDGSTVARLATAFRADVRSATSARIVQNQDGTTTLELDRPDMPALRYAIEGRGLVRTERSGKETRRRESFAVERLDPVRFERDGPILRLALVRGNDDLTRPRMRAIRIEAVLDKDRGSEHNAEAGK
jgi:prepilin-type N-terminal cleavage/methylation domain-containing protein